MAPFGTVQLGVERYFNEADFALAVVMPHEPEAVRIFNSAGATT